MVEETIAAKRALSTMHTRCLLSPRHGNLVNLLSILADRMVLRSSPRDHFTHSNF
jgi:hypothetical protein